MGSIAQQCPWQTLANASACPHGACLKKPTALTKNALQWLSLKDLLQDVGIACIDGRHRECALGTPGGDAGELVLLLSALEATAGIELSAEQVGEALLDYTDSLGQFYLHSDALAFTKLLCAAEGATPCAQGPMLPRRGADYSASDAQRNRFDLALGSDERDSAAGDAVEAFTAASLPRQQLLLPLLTDPEHVGCGHLRSMLLDPEGYGVRRPLVQWVIRAFFKELWAKNAKMRFVLLEGHHTERALVTFHTTEPLSPSSAIPTPCGTEERGVFVHHGSVLEYLRSQTLAALRRGRLGAWMPHAFTGQLDQQVAQRSCQHLGTTARKLAPALNRYCIKFDSTTRQLI